MKNSNEGTIFGIKLTENYFLAVILKPYVQKHAKSCAHFQGY